MLDESIRLYDYDRIAQSCIVSGIWIFQSLYDVASHYHSMYNLFLISYTFRAPTQFSGYFSCFWRPGIYQCIVDFKSS
jgi:hypothetical protein